MRRASFIALAVLTRLASAADAQPTPSVSAVTAEVDVTLGYSTERVRAAAAQARLFGEARSIRFYLEGTWAEVAGDPDTDAFGSAYPYDGGAPHAMEMYAERVFRPGGYLAAVRVGRYRTPFGIHGRSDHAYGGYLRAPLIRYDDYFALSNTFLEGGIDFTFGRPDLSVETSIGVPQDPTSTRRRDGLGWVVRGQVFRGGLIAGASHIRTRPSRTRPFARGEAVFTGVDWRWMRSGVAIRGEWIMGRPFDGTTTSGWYVDGLVHRPSMGPATAVLRAEGLNYAAGPRSFYPRRFTCGARVVLTRALVAHVNIVAQRDLPLSNRKALLDAALSYTVRIGSRQ